jgi:hypothetical protein
MLHHVSEVGGVRVGEHRTVSEPAPVQIFDRGSARGRVLAAPDRYERVEDGRPRPPIGRSVSVRDRVGDGEEVDHELPCVGTAERAGRALGARTSQMLIKPMSPVSERMGTSCPEIHMSLTHRPMRHGSLRAASRASTLRDRLRKQRRAGVPRRLDGFNRISAFDPYPFILLDLVPSCIPAPGPSSCPDV